MPTVADVSQKMVENFQADEADGIDAVVQFELTGTDGGQFYLIIKDNAVKAVEGVADAPKTTVKADLDDYAAVSRGELNAMQAFMSGKLKVSGDMGFAMKMQKIFRT